MSIELTFDVDVSTKHGLGDWPAEQQEHSCISELHHHTDYDLLASIQEALTEESSL